MHENDYEQEDPSVEVEEAPWGKGARVSKSTRLVPRPYRVVGIDSRGRKIRTKAPWNTAQEEVRRATHVRVRRGVEPTR